MGIEDIGTMQEKSWRGYNIPGDMGLVASSGLWKGDLQPNPGIPPDRGRRAEQLLLTEYDESPLIHGFLKSIVAQMDEIELVMAYLRLINDIDFATGPDLDVCGDLVGADRQGLSDLVYRAFIKFKIFLNRSNGEPETIIQFVKYITEAEDVQYLEVYPAKVLLFVKSAIIVSSEIANAIQQLAAGGVEIITIFTQEGEDFGFETEAGLPEDSTVLGFGEAANPLQLLFPVDAGPVYIEWGYLPGARPATISFPNGLVSLSILDDGGFYFPQPYDIQTDTFIEIDLEYVGGEQDRTGFGVNLISETAPDATRYWQFGGTGTPFGHQDFNGDYNFGLGGVQTITIPLGIYFVGMIDFFGFENLSSPPGAVGISMIIHEVRIHNQNEFVDVGGRFVEVFTEDT